MIRICWVFYTFMKYAVDAGTPQLFHTSTTKDLRLTMKNIGLNIIWLSSNKLSDYRLPYVFYRASTHTLECVRFCPRWGRGVPSASPPFLVTSLLQEYSVTRVIWRMKWLFLVRKFLWAAWNYYKVQKYPNWVSGNFLHVNYQWGQYRAQRQDSSTLQRRLYIGVNN